MTIEPCCFYQYGQKRAKKIIIDLIQYHWDLNTIKEWFDEILQDVDYQKHILEILKQIDIEYGFYFTQRQEVNRKIRFKKQL